MEGVVVRRVIPSDNSCLFNAVGYVMEHNKHKAPELRQVIAAAVASDPEKKYKERVMLIYDGLHYDALALTPSDSASEEFDQTIFPVDYKRSIGPAENLALNLVKDAHRKRSFTDTSNFTLRCGVCQIGVIGQKEAAEHAQATGHINFQEYR
ncbi:ubiquitin thioesterase OTU1 isoform X3 [Carex littledalei]|uniref:Ubiquitin thioesterase OTU n=1 Tax=Carex littledalei TaxID=544730 RepID=A0A833RM58_9POAL|nr:ubiquitin thioesterase OTU1 isoform X3 [Carex littledalei]